LTDSGIFQIIEALLIHNEKEVEEDRAKAQHSLSVIGLLDAILPIAIDLTEENKVSTG